MTDTPFDIARADIVRQIDAESDAIASLQRQVAGHEIERDRLAAHLAGMDQAYLLLIGSAKPVPVSLGQELPRPERKRQDVQGPIMDWITKWGAASEARLSAALGLPEASVHTFLLRAIRDGKLVRDGELYRLPEQSPAGQEVGASDPRRRAETSPEEGGAAADGGAAPLAQVPQLCPHHPLQTSREASGRLYCAEPGCDWPDGEEQRQAAE